MDCSCDPIFGRPNSGRLSEFPHKLYLCDLNIHTTNRPFIPCSNLVKMNSKADQGNKKAGEVFNQGVKVVASTKVLFYYSLHQPMTHYRFYFLTILCLHTGQSSSLLKTWSPPSVALSKF